MIDDDDNMCSACGGSGGSANDELPLIKVNVKVKSVSQGGVCETVPVRITPKGSALIRSFFPGHVARIVNQMSILSKAEMDELGRLCRKVGLQKTGI